MEDIESLGFCSPSYFPFANVKNEEYANIENLLSSDPEVEATENYGQKCDSKSSKKYSSFCSDLPNVNPEDSSSEKNIPQLHSHKKKKKKHSSSSSVGNPFMSARQVGLQPSASDQSEKNDEDEDDVLSGSEERSKNQCLAQEEDVPCKPISKLHDSDVGHQKDLSNKDTEAKATKIKPVFGRPTKKADHVSKKSKKTKGDSLDVVKSDVKNKKNSLSLEINMDDPKSLSDQSHCIITEEDEEDSFCLSAKVCSQSSSKKNSEEAEQIVPDFSWKKSKSKSKHLKKSPLKEMNVPVDVTNSGSEKHKKRSLIEISSSILNSDHHHKKDSNSSAPSEKKSKEKKKKSKNSGEKSDICPMVIEENPSSPETTTEEVCNIPKKKRKKSVNTSSFADQDEDENDGPVITNVRSLVDNFDQDLNNDESPSLNDVQPAAESPTSTDNPGDPQEHKKKKKKKKSKEESPKEEDDSCEKPAKKHKKRKKKKEKSDGNENVKVEMMPEEIVPTIDECEAAEDEEMEFPRDVDSGSDKEESQAVVPAKEEVKFKCPQKSEKQSSVKKKNDKSKKKEMKKDKQKQSKDKSKKKCNVTNQQKVRCKRFCMQEREIFDTGTWVQCTNSECLKWRFLHDVQDPITVPMLWTCDMNTDTKQNDCSYPEIVPSNKDNDEFIYTKYTEGTVVWARVDGYPWWPAMVEMDPDSMSYFDIETEDSMYPKYYHVVFFGKKVSRAWVTVSNIAPFTESKPPPTSKGTPRTRTQEINAAEKLAVRALDVPINTRLKMFSFSSRYKGTWGDCSCHVCKQAVSTAADQDSEENL